MVRASTVRDDAGFGLPPVISHSGLAGRLACLFAVGALLCVSVAQGQVIEEGGFPVKGGGVSGESFSLSCPSRLYVAAGESVLLSCTAEGVPEEGVRYGWESVSGEGLRLLGAPDELSPLFTAPLSGESVEYAYRLTAMSAGVYETATVRVVVGGVPGESVGSPVVREDCDPFGVSEGFGEGCVEDKGPAPFGFVPEGEGGLLFPEAPVLPDRPSGPVRGGGSAMQAPPRLECPAAIFLEELETGQVECRAWDASGEEYLEYSWEPVGGTTRDYLGNPRLIPEDSPTPSVVAPEAPAYETLESFLSGDRAFRYRYRLTATSRATGLSSRTEVEVFVSSSRPGVYCPLEVAAQEGETVALDCEGVDPLSSRMDYDDEEASVLWEWEGLWGASTSHLDAADRSSPLFTAPPNSAGEQYHYIASMTSSSSGFPRTARRRVTVTVVEGEGGAQAAADDSALIFKGSAPAVTCNDSEVYEATADFKLACTVTDEPSDATYEWTAQGGMRNGSLRTAVGFRSPMSLLSATDIVSPTFDVPHDIHNHNSNEATDDAYKEIFKYRLTMYSGNVSVDYANVEVTVLEKPDIICAGDLGGDRIATGVGLTIRDGEAGGLMHVCLNSAPLADPLAGSDYMIAWTVDYNTPEAALSLLSATDVETPWFTVPDPHLVSCWKIPRIYTLNLPRHEYEGFFWCRYYYTRTVTAENMDPLVTGIETIVVKRPTVTVVCREPEPVYEGAPDFGLSCDASGVSGGNYAWSWSPTTRLRYHDTSSPWFDVPYDVDRDTTYAYTVTAAAANAHVGSATVKVTVKDTGGLPPAVACSDPDPVYEGSADITLDCEASGAPAGSAYEYFWTPRGDTPNTALLSATNIASPVFHVPDEVDEDETYEYLLAVSAANAGSATAEVTVTVLNRGSLALACADPGSVYEGSEDIAFDCTASGAPAGSAYEYVWTPRGGAAGTDLLGATDISSPTFYVPDAVDVTTDYEYLLTVSADNAGSATAEVTVTVLNLGSLRVACADPGSVYEGSEDIVFDCTASGAPGDDPQYTYIWTARGSASNTDLLGATDISSPTFHVPDAVDVTTDYEYLLTVSADNAGSATAEVTVTVLNLGSLRVACADPGSVYEGSEDIVFDCTASGAPGDDPQYTYIWTARGSASNTDLLGATDISSPTFYVPDAVDVTTDYEYLLTVSTANAEDASAEVTVTVLNKEALALSCADPGSVYEGSADITLDCTASGAPEGSDYAYAWTARGSAADTDLLSRADIASPTFHVPDEVDATTTYEYTLTASADNAEDASAEVTVTVLNKEALAVTCADPGSVYEGSADVALDCSASGAPSGSAYAYVWTARGSATDTDLLGATDIASPTFYVPDEVDQGETYEYLLTASAANAEDASAEVTVTVLNKEALALSCADPGSVYEGSADITLDCTASGAPEGSDYAYAWTARGSAADTDLLSRADIASPTFYVPDAVDVTTTYEYLLTASAANAEDASAEVTVTVLNKEALAVTCADPGSVYEGSEDVAFDCSASGAPSGSAYAYVWTAWGSATDTDLLSATDIASPTFHVPEEVEGAETYEYLLTVSTANAEDASAEVTVTVLDKEALALACADPGSVYEGSSDIAFDCSASGAPSGSAYAYVWTARGSATDTDLLSATDIASPTFYVPDEVDQGETYEYLLTASADNAEDASAEVTVTVLNKEALALSCADPGSVYEGSADITFDCTASGAPEGSDYAYVWTARGSAADTDLLSRADIASPTFLVPDEVDATTTYEYTLTASADNAEDASAEVTVTVLNKEALALACADPGSVYEGSSDIAFDCSASGAPSGSAYAYVWTARGSATDTDLLSATDIASPTFYVPDEVDQGETYEYLLTASADNAEDASAEVTVTVLNKEALALSCADPGSVYEGSADITFDCTASGAPSDDPQYTYAWTARGSAADTDLLSATDIASPTFYVPDEVDETTTYEYTLTVSADNAEDGAAEVSVTVLNKGSLALACTDPGSVYEGSADVAFDCTASGAPGDDPVYTYVWTARGATANTALLSATDISSPVFFVPDEVEADETYEYLLTVSAENAEDASAEAAVTVLDRVVLPPSGPFSSPLTSSSVREPSDPSSLGVTASASPLRFGVQSADTQASLDPMTDRISTHISGPYHAGRMTLSPGGGEALGENGEMDLSIELASPVMLRRKGGVEDALIVLSPQWSFAESCEQLSSQAIGGLYTEVTLSEDACRLLYFGGELDLTGVPSGRYAGSMDIILRSGENEETHSVEVHVTVIPAQRVITIGPGGVRFSTSRELPAGLTEEQNLSIYPDVAFMTEEKPHGMFELSNPSLVPLEVTVSARFGYTEATENGREVVVEDASGSHLGDLSQVVDIYPGVLVLMPGEKGLVRYGIEAGALTAMAERGYAAFFDVASEPRQYVRSDQMPEEVAGDRTARVTMRVPGVYVPGEAASQLRATLMSISYVGSMSATFLVETQDHPFVGEVVAYDGDGRELGRRETLVYTRSRVRVPLNRMPEEDAVFLRFSPRGSDRVPAPASVEWDAPRRGIGAAKDKKQTPGSAAIAGKP